MHLGKPSRISLFLFLCLAFSTVSFLATRAVDLVNQRLEDTVASDFPIHMTAFELYATSKWDFPLGEVHDFGDSNLIILDGAPILALLAKAIYHCTGLFLNLSLLIPINFILFSFMSARIALLTSRHFYIQVLIAGLLIFHLAAPTRITGAQHIALSSYWTILWAMCCNIRSYRELRHAFLESMACAVITFLIHPYLGAMATVIVLTGFYRQRFFAKSSAVLAAVAIALGAFGCFTHTYPLYRTIKKTAINLAAFLYSQDWAWTGNWFHPSDPSQQDAYVYLGTGALFLLAIIVIDVLWVSILRRRACGESDIETIPPSLIIAVTLLLFYATVFKISFAGITFFDINYLSIFDELYGRFRMAGRFAIPFAYFLILWISLQLSRVSTKRLPIAAIVTSCLFLQAVDSFHAAKHATHGFTKLIEATQQQIQAIDSLGLQGTWSHRVITYVTYPELEELRLADYILLKRGATYYSDVHTARSNGNRGRTRPVLGLQSDNGIQAGDVLVFSNSEDASRYKCARTARLKTFSLCLTPATRD